MMTEREWVWNLFHFILTLAWLGDDGDDSQTQLTLCSHTQNKNSTRVEIFYEIEGGWLGKNGKNPSTPSKNALFYSYGSEDNSVSFTDESWKVFQRQFWGISHTHKHTQLDARKVLKNPENFLFFASLFPWFWFRSIVSRCWCNLSM